MSDKVSFNGDIESISISEFNKVITNIDDESDNKIKNIAFLKLFMSDIGKLEGGQNKDYPSILENLAALKNTLQEQNKEQGWQTIIEHIDAYIKLYQNLIGNVSDNNAYRFLGKYVSSPKTSVRMSDLMPSKKLLETLEKYFKVMGKSLVSQYQIDITDELENLTKAIGRFKQLSECLRQQNAPILKNVKKDKNSNVKIFARCMFGLCGILGASLLLYGSIPVVTLAIKTPVFVALLCFAYMFIDSVSKLYVNCINNVQEHIGNLQFSVGQFIEYINLHNDIKLPTQADENALVMENLEHDVKMNNKDDYYISGDEIISKVSDDINLIKKSCMSIKTKIINNISSAQNKI